MSPADDVSLRSGRRRRDNVNLSRGIEGYPNRDLDAIEQYRFGCDAELQSDWLRRRGPVEAPEHALGI